MNIELALNGEAVALLVGVIGALEEDCAKIVGGPEWMGETICAMTNEQRMHAVACLLAAAHNPYREGPVRVRVWGEVPDLEARIAYSCGDPCAGRR